MLLILDVDDSPLVLSASDWLAIDDDVAFASDYGEGDEGLFVTGGQKDCQSVQNYSSRLTVTHSDSLIQLSFILIIIRAVKRVNLNIMVRHFIPDRFLESSSFFQGQRVRFSNDGDDIDYV